MGFLGFGVLKIGIWGFLGSLDLGFWDKFGVLGSLKLGFLWGFGVFWVLGGIRGAAARGRSRPVFFHYAANRKCLDRKRRSTGSRKLSGAARTEVSVGREMWGGGRGVVGLREPPQRSGEGGGAAPRLWGGDLWGRDLWGCPTSVGQFRIYGAVICGAVPSLSGVVLWGSPTATGQASMG